ncbi:hypothetical protein [Candidatus Venteria ishoeyi]|uniref:Uncharacterized protein n=1 Tax=Candidatus Venteria ishoeyi TaxID=1899563 RepID=A0A1H6F5G8_9GAMM|nr:hypothetical protein [Candidatus Venteria ishoeyi]SEH05380.1 Uncharacterised protein [Candidatus Venteria ishoeyi]
MGKVIGLLEQNYLQGVDYALADIKAEFLNLFIDVYHKKLNLPEFQELLKFRCEVNERALDSVNLHVNEKNEIEATATEIEGLYRVNKCMLEILNMTLRYMDKENIEKDFPSCKDELPF